MDDSNLYSKIDFLNPQYDKKEKIGHFSLDINESFYSSVMNDNNFSTDKNEIVNKNDIFDEFEKILKEDGEINNNKSSMNKEETKKQLRLKRNRESAKEGRLRKKIYFENLIRELNELQIQNSILLKIITKCPLCKEEYEKEMEKNEEKNEKINYILKDEKPISKKTKLLFMTAVTLISIINMFNIFSFNRESFKFKQTRDLSDNEPSELLLNKIKTSNKKEALLIHFAEYYSLTTREKVDGSNDLNNEINKNIRIYSDNSLNINRMNQTNAQNCVKCMVEIDKNSIKFGGDEFTFYLVDKLLSKNFMNNLEDGIFPELNFEKENKKSETFSKVKLI